MRALTVANANLRSLLWV